MRIHDDANMHDSDANAPTHSAAAAAILGLAVGDALGVPVEFSDREELRRDPLTSMRGEGTHSQPAGTWSDDTSLALCLAESLCETGIDHQDQAKRFVRWLYEAEWTPWGEVFDVGIATRAAIQRLARGVSPTSAGLAEEHHCGNGSLMRVAPLAVFLAYAPPPERFQASMDASRLTHGHPRCQLACGYFVEVAASLVRGRPLASAISAAEELVLQTCAALFPAELPTFKRLRGEQIGVLSYEELRGSGYVIDTLQSSLWCAQHATCYTDGVLAAVNLGDDTDTTGAVAGALLGLMRGCDAIPLPWQESLARYDDILRLCQRFQRACERRWQADLRAGGMPPPPLQSTTD